MLPPIEPQRYHFHSRQEKCRHRINYASSKDPVNCSRHEQAPRCPVSQLQAPLNNPQCYCLRALHHWLASVAPTRVQCLSWTDPRYFRLDGEVIKSKHTVCPPLLSKFKANRTNLTKFIPSAQSRHEKMGIFHVFQENFQLSRVGETPKVIYTAEVSSLFTASAKMNKLHLIAVGNCTWPVVLWSSEWDCS